VTGASDDPREALRHALAQLTVSQRQALERALREEPPAEILVAAVVPEPGAAPPDAETIRGHVAERLPSHHVPSVVVAVQELPRLTSGKVDVAAIAPASVPAPSGASHDLTPVEAWLAEVWAEVLGVEVADARCDFFDLGGTSLTGMRMIVEIAAVLGVEMRLRALFGSSRLGDFAAVVGALARADPSAVRRLEVVAEVYGLTDDEADAGLEPAASAEVAR
jgi:hypothetical protein